MSILQLILFIVVTILIIISAIYTVKAAAEIAKFSNFKTDKHLDLAHKWLTYASIVGWVGVALLILGIFLMVYTLSSRLTFIIFFALAIILALGVLAALGASQINQSENLGVGIIKTAFDDALVATLTALIGGILLMGVFFYLVFFSTASAPAAKQIILVGSGEGEEEESSSGGESTKEGKTKKTKSE